MMFIKPYNFLKPYSFFSRKRKTFHVLLHTSSAQEKKSKKKENGSRESMSSRHEFQIMTVLLELMSI